jgi:AraC-like DNA-binding protein
MQAAPVSMDLSPLTSRCVFRSTARVETHDQVSAEFSDHGLAWKNGNVDTKLCKTRVRQLQAFMLQYGAEVEIRPRPFKDFVLVHMSLAGTIDMESDGQRASLPAGKVAVLAPKQGLNMRWEQGARQLILKVPQALMHSDTARKGPPCPDPVRVLQGAQEMQWKSMMQSLMFASQPGNDVSAANPWADHLEKSIALFLGLCSEPAASACDTRTGSPASDTDQRRIAALQHYIRSHLCAPVALEDLARATGLGSRALHLLCKRHFNQPPMLLLRSMRLDAARARLLQAPHSPITDLALEFGFEHLGRFSSYYRARFNELPSDTVMQRLELQ